MNREITNTTALILVDVQKGFLDPTWGRRNNLQAEGNMSRLLSVWRERNHLIVHVKHNSRLIRSTLHPTHPGNALRDEVQPLPGERLIEKDVNCAFVGTELEMHLRANGIADLMMVGLTTPHCVSTTAIIGANLGFGVSVVEDATVAFELQGMDGKAIAPEEVHYHALAALHREFAEITNTETVLQATIGGRSNYV